MKDAVQEYKSREKAMFAAGTSFDADDLLSEVAEAHNVAVDLLAISVLIDGTGEGS